LQNWSKKVQVFVFFLPYLGNANAEKEQKFAYIGKDDNKKIFSFAALFP
jgi:hypothetical protein